MKRIICNYGLILICSLLAFALLFAVNISYELETDEIPGIAELFFKNDMFGKIDGVSYVDFFTDVKEYGEPFGNAADGSNNEEFFAMGTLAKIACIAPIVLGIIVMIMAGFCILVSAIGVIYALLSPKKAVEEEKKAKLAGTLAKGTIIFPILAYISMWLPVIFGNMAFRSLLGDKTEYQFSLSFDGGINYLIAVIAVIVVYIVGKVVINVVFPKEKEE